MLDSLKYNNIKYWINSDSTIIYTDDSVYFFYDSLSFLIENKSKTKTEAFYDSIKSKANNYWLLKEVYNLVLCNPKQVVSSGKQETLEFENPFLKYEAKVIRNIDYKKLEIFGFEHIDSLSVTKSGLINLLNNTHVNTLDRVLKNNLLFKENDIINPGLMADNERILRDISYISDARFLIVPVSKDSVDVIVITKDIFSLALDGKIHNKDSVSISILNNNIMGTGHKFNIDILMNHSEMKPVGYNAYYKIENIGGSFVGGKLIYDNAFDITNYEIDLKRNFIAKKFKYAGGLNLKQSKLIESNLFAKKDTVKYNYEDLWLGRAFDIPISSNNILKGSQLVVSGRFLRKEYCERPKTDNQTNKKYYKRNLFINSIAVSKRNYYKSNLIYEYGRTEDIPYGYLMEFINAYEINEFGNRFYSGINYSFGKLKNYGYIYGSISTGGFFNESTLEQGHFKIETQYFSHLKKVGSYHFRHFVNIECLFGINRFENELIFFRNYSGLRGLYSNSLYGTNRFSINFESIIFTPWHYYGFKFVFYSFLDLGTIGNNSSFIFDENYYSGIGLGFRIRNENLLFKTFQFRFVYYPMIPDNISKFVFQLSGKNVHRFNDFEVNIPETFNFE